jgi:hypothetical protein
MQPGIYICRDEDGVFLAQLAEDGIWNIFGLPLAVAVQPDEVVAGPFTVEQILEAVAGRKIP